MAIPLYNSFQILSSIFLSEAYFDDFRDYTLYQGLIFSFGLICIIIGIIFVTIGQNSVSMANHSVDQMKYSATIHQMIVEGKSLDDRLRTMSMSSMVTTSSNINSRSSRLNSSTILDCNPKLTIEEETETDSDSQFDENARLLD